MMREASKLFATGMYGVCIKAFATQVEEVG